MIKAGIGIGPHDVVAIRLIAETPAVADPGSVAEGQHVRVIDHVVL